MTHKTHRGFPTARDTRALRPARGGRPSAGQIFFCLMSTFCFVLILRNSDAAIAYMGRGLTLCARTVIPSLFPFMVISELLVSSGAGEALGRLFSRLMRWVFGLSGAGASAVFLGSMCGFPVGARTAVGLLDRNVISKAECEHLLTFTSNPSSAFLITAVGVSLFGNRRLGVMLYCVVLGTSLLIGFLARFFMRGKGIPAEHPHFPMGLHPGGVEMFTSAVTGAASAMLTVCAYVIFFSAITGALGDMVTAEVLGEVPFALLYGLLELSGGISQASTLANRDLAVVLAAAMAGWSGVSVHCQVMTLCAGRGLSFRPYLLAKAAQAVLCAAVVTLLLRFGDPAWLTPAADTVVDALADLAALRELTIPAAITDTAFVVGWGILCVKRWQEEGEI